MRRKRSGLVVALCLLVGAGAFAFTGWRLGYTSPPSYSPAQSVSLGAPLRTWDEHGDIYRASPDPYVVEATSGDGALVFLGVRHTQNPENPQIDEIKARWDTFEPTVALCEGRLGLYLGGFDAGVRMFGEPGGVYALARNTGVQIYSLEAAYQDEIGSLLEEHEPRRVAMFYTLRVFWGEGGHERDSVEGKDRLLRHLLSKRTDVAGLRGVFDSVEEFDAFWRSEFPDRPSWRDEAGEHPEGSPMRAVELASREARTEHMAKVAIDLTRQGERVFAVAGKSHVIRMEPALRTALDAR